MVIQARARDQEELDIAFSGYQAERSVAYLGYDCEAGTQTGSGSELGGSPRGSVRSPW